MVGEDEINKNEDENGIWRLESQVNAYLPVLLPTQGKNTKWLAENYHLKSLHGVVQAFTYKIRETVWIPKLRRIVKTVIKKSNLCKRYRKKPLKPPITSKLPEFRTQISALFTTTGIDSAGPLLYKVHK